ncbi:MAG: ribokinase, partial [Candidatus Dormibacteraeota bacterium]|nr:ribokinase [Candidatus Dormibacteraeota bacterium]
MKAVSIAVVGSLNYDLLAYVDHLPRPGGTIPATEVRRALGGKGFNQAVAARRLGAKVRMVGAVGSDDFGADFERRLDELGIDRAGVRRLEAPTGLALVTVDRRGENTIVLAGGANLEVRPADLDAPRVAADALLVQGELRPEAAQRAMELASGLKVLNCAPASLELSPAAGLADVVVVNEGEAAEMGGADRLAELGAGAVVVTLGARGAQIENTVLPAPRIRAVDTTGSGDAFCGALAVALAEGQDLEA